MDNMKIDSDCERDSDRGRIDKDLELDSDGEVSV